MADGFVKNLALEPVVSLCRGAHFQGCACLRQPYAAELSAQLTEGECVNNQPKSSKRLNTITVPFKVSERYPDFAKLVKKAEKWWKDHIETGISPAYDEKADAEILKELRTNTHNPESDIEALLKEGEELKLEIDRLSAPIEPLEKRLRKSPSRNYRPSSMGVYME